MTRQANLFWRWSEAIPPALCNLLLEEIKDMPLIDGSIGMGERLRIDAEFRSGKTIFLPPGHWFEGVMFNYARLANVYAEWDFDIAGCEMLQIASYKAGEKYSWHVDNFIYQADEWHRKITVVCQLSKASDFTGGGLFIRNMNREESLTINQGDVVAFPSLVEHQAVSVDSGHRITIVCWATGKRFK